MRFLLTTAFFFCSVNLLAQVSAYSLPKYPAKMSNLVRESGPKPGSPAQPDQTATFIRTTYMPAELRLVARANCSTTPGSGALIGRARSSSEAHGPVVQVDWEPVRTDKPGFWAVLETRAVVVTVNLREKDGQFVTVNKDHRESTQWHTAPLQFKDGTRCVVEKEITAAEMRKAVRNVLHQITLAHYRSPTGS